MHTTSVLVAVQDQDLLVSLLIFLREATDLSVVGTASDVASIVALVQSTQADVVLIDESLMVAAEQDILDAPDHFVPRPGLVVLAAEEGDSPARGAADTVVYTHTSPMLLIQSLRQVAESNHHVG